MGKCGGSVGEPRTVWAHPNPGAHLCPGCEDCKPVCKLCGGTKVVEVVGIPRYVACGMCLDADQRDAYPHPCPDCLEEEK